MSTMDVVLTMLVSFAGLLVIPYLLLRRKLRAELASESHIVHTAAGPVEYVDIGQGPAVIHAHGMLGGVDHVRYCGFLVKGGFRLIVPSRPGYLRTPIISGKTPKEHAAIYEALMDALGIDQVAFYAISQGGASSIEFALAYPERCWGLVLVSAFTRPPETSWISKVVPYVRAAMALDFVMWLLRPVILAVLMKQARKALSRSDQQDTETMAGLKAFFGTVSQASLRGPGLINDFHNLLHWRGVPLDQLQVPALVIHGTNDVFVKFEDSEATAAEIPGARFLSVRGAGHEAFISRVDLIGPETLGFFRTLTPRKRAV